MTTNTLEFSLLGALQRRYPVGMYPPGHAPTQARNTTGAPALLEHIGCYVQTGMAMPTLQDNVHIRRQLTEPHWHFLNKQGPGTRDVPGVILPGLTQIHNHDVVTTIQTSF